MEMSDTPRVDAMIMPDVGIDPVTGEPVDVVHADDARQLERENAKLEKQIDELCGQLDELSKSYASAIDKLMGSKVWI